MATLKYKVKKSSTYHISVSCTGYSTQEVRSQTASGDYTHSISLTPLSYEVKVTVNDADLNGSMITSPTACKVTLINPTGGGVLYSANCNASGVVTFSVPHTTKYQIKVEHADYTTHYDSGTFTVNAQAAAYIIRLVRAEVTISVVYSPDNATVTMRNASDNSVISPS